MKIALISSNAHHIGPNTKKGTEIFVNILSHNLAKYKKDFSFTLFASSDSDVPLPIKSLGLTATTKDKEIITEKIIIFELALISKAFSEQNKFDLYHVNIGDGDLILPFAQFVQKPIVITIHYIYDLPYLKKYFSLFKNLKNIYFVSVSDAQRKILPDINYIKTIYHGIEEDKFTFSETGGEDLMWAGRGIPLKGLDTALQISQETGKKVNSFVIKKPEYMQWLDKVLIEANNFNLKNLFNIKFDVNRQELIHEYQNSKVFIFPTTAEEVFGLVGVEAMACGTPIIAYAKGALPEIIKDGITGFLVNPPGETVGNYIIKKQGKEGLVEAVRKLYSLNKNDYLNMRLNCRKHVEKSFTAKRMADDYIKLYKEIKIINAY